jgi:hypothetical protein
VRKTDVEVPGTDVRICGSSLLSRVGFPQLHPTSNPDVDPIPSPPGKLTELFRPWAPRKEKGIDIRKKNSEKRLQRGLFRE